MRIDEEASEPLPAGTVLGGRYEVRKLIGRGGMGLVVEAWDATLGVAVAIKIVRSEYAGEREWSERLAREVKLARKIQHPNVCRVFDFGQADGRAFLSMELAEGGTLRSQLAEGAAGARARSLADRLADARAVAAGVAAIHGAGIVHRDLSPQNVLRMKDGRLVVSDFGLATDSFDGASSIHGGTVAYMAPEVLRGGKASVAADIWSLGAVIHEVVFGERLRWDAKSAEVRSAVAGQALTSVERSVLEICRACTTPDPARRPRDAGQVAVHLGEAALSRAGRRRWRRRAIAAATAGAVIVAAASAARLVQSRRRRAVATPMAAPSDPLLIVPTGEPDDWTDKSKVLAEVPDRIRCMVALPDHHTVRFVWGYPVRAEDVDTRTGERRPSPLVPDAYAEGCPDLSADGKRLVYTGYTSDDRAWAFVSTHPDGSHATPELQTAEPTLYSQPVWLADGESFVYDVDDRHVAAYSLRTKRTVIVPGTESMYTVVHEAIGNQIFVNSLLDRAATTEIAGFQSPRLEEVVRWRVPTMVMNLVSAGGTTYYYTAFKGLESEFVAIDPFRRTAHFVGAVPGQSIGIPLSVEGGLGFVSAKRLATLVLRAAGQEPRRLPVGDEMVWASACGSRIIGEKYLGDFLSRIVWLDALGKVGGVIGPNGLRRYPRCSSDGNVIFYGVLGKNPGILRCESSVCRMIYSGRAVLPALSPNDRRLAFLSFDSGGRRVRWISSDGSGPVHEVAESQNGCSSVWSDDRDIWISLRKGRRLIWTEFNTDSARPTGRTSPGRHDCTDGLDDFQRPLHSPVELEINSRSQVRFLPATYLSIQAGSR
ncbi:MAG TPA: serine/threonine-protein kinase [Polyangia bacterium]|nr:serine/threonine-protein kinase [Polyangia bacterium]